jgi:hypothetical protein
LAHGLHAAGIEDRHTVAIMCRTHRGLIEATVACSKLRADVLYPDPEIAPGALKGLLDSQDPHALIYDEEFSELLDQGTK